MSKILADHAPFEKFFEIVPLKPVYEMAKDEGPKLAEIVRGVDLFVGQDVSSEYLEPGTRALVGQMPSGGTALLFQVAWFDAYNPDMTYLASRPGGPFGDYHSRILVECFKAGFSECQTLETFEGEWHPETIKINVAENLIRLREREAALDIGIADEVERSFQDHLLFYTVNHPTPFMQFYMVDRVLKSLGLRLLDKETKAKHASLFSTIQWPINKSVGRALGLKFKPRQDFRYGDGNVDPKAFIARNFEFYSSLNPGDLN